MCDQQSLRSACAYAQSEQSLYSSLEYSMSVKLLTEHLFEVLSLKGGCTGSSESTLVKMPHCWKSYAMAQLLYQVEFTKGLYAFQGQTWMFVWASMGSAILSQQNMLSSSMMR